MQPAVRVALQVGGRLAAGMLSPEVDVMISTGCTSEVWPSARSNSTWLRRTLPPIWNRWFPFIIERLSLQFQYCEFQLRVRVFWASTFMGISALVELSPPSSRAAFAPGTWGGAPAVFQVQLSRRMLKWNSLVTVGDNRPVSPTTKYRGWRGMTDVGLTGLL